WCADVVIARYGVVRSVVMVCVFILFVFFFFFNDTATTEIYTLSLHDARPIYRQPGLPDQRDDFPTAGRAAPHASVHVGIRHAQFGVRTTLRPGIEPGEGWPGTGRTRKFATWDRPGVSFRVVGGPTFYVLAIHG